MTAVLWTLAGFVAGSLPFSPWVGRLALHTDIRGYGDGNPGAANVMRAGGWAWGAAALLLDYLKGATPVGLAHYYAGLNDWRLIPIALAPVLGHAFSPFLHFRGGKAVTVTFGVWTGLTLWVGPTLLGVLLGFWSVWMAGDGWAVMVTMLSFLLCLLLAGSGPTLWAVWAGNAIVLAWKHRADLARWPGVRPWVKRSFPR